MHWKSLLTPLALFLSTAHAVDKTSDADLDAKIKLSATQLDKFSLLNNASWLFDFTKQPMYTYNPVVNGNAATFPAATGYGLTIAMLNLGPCAMLPPHLHPRATNFVVAIEGVTDTYMLQENGAPLVKQTLSPFQMTIFPAGSMHTMQNTGCNNATLVSALNSDDSGTLNALNFAHFPQDLVAAAFGNPADGLNFGSIPPVGTGSIMGSATCRAACGL
jgi:hypothetical protein